MCNGAPKHDSTGESPYNSTLHTLGRLTFVLSLYSQFLAFGEESYSAQGRESRRTFLPCIFPLPAHIPIFNRRMGKGRRERESSSKEGREKKWKKSKRKLDDRIPKADFDGWVP